MRAWPSAPDPRLSGEPGVWPPGPPHLGLSEEGQPGPCGQARGVGPRGLRRLTIASSEGPGRPSRSSPGARLQPPPSGRWSRRGAAPGLRRVFPRRGGWSVSGWAEQPLPGPAPSARWLQPPFPSSSSLCTLAPGAGGRGGGWSFTFFRSSPSCRKQHQMTRAGSTAPGPEAAGNSAGPFPGRGGDGRREGQPRPRPDLSLMRTGHPRPPRRRQLRTWLGSGANASLASAPELRPMPSAPPSHLKWGLALPS